MCEFKAGDFVRIRTDLQIGRLYGRVDLLKGMAEYLGNTFEIEKIDFSGCGTFYRFGYHWSPEMLELISGIKEHNEVLINLYPFEDEWAVEFPETPGCFGGGETPGKAVEDGLYNLKSYLATLKDMEDK